MEAPGPPVPPPFEGPVDDEPAGRTDAAAAAVATAAPRFGPGFGPGMPPHRGGFPGPRGRRRGAPHRAR